VNRHEKEHSVGKWGTILLAGFIFSKLGAVLFKFICAGYFGPEEYGRVAVFLVLFTWLLLAATLNVTFGLNKFVCAEPGKRKLYYRSSVVWCTLISLCVSAFVIIAGPHVFGALGGAAFSWALAVSMPLATFYNLAIFYMRARCRMKASTIADGLLMASRVVILAALIWFVPLGSAAPYAAFAGSFLLADLAICFFMGGRVEKAKGRSFAAFRVMAAYSLPIFIGEVLRFVSMDSDRLFLAAFHGTMKTGIYDIAASLCIGYVIIANAYGSALFPAIAHKKSDRKRGLLNALKPVAGLYAVYSIALALLAGPIAGFIGPEYYTITGFVPFVMAGGALTGIFTLLCFFVNAINHQRQALYASAVFAFLNLGMNLYLVPGMNYYGAALALVVSSAAACVFLSVQSLRAFRGAGK
jgi:O-antigen/teichoic acid export membrane protein